ncbi:DUF6348 family protein [Actinomadura rugatobispora]|uniref:DUF6348 family protein n=1 Tax=Actinomadura rugatobispora TaxID=1994 RepID=A0ABW0ZWR2_9ACTN|nr:hypothetical protein GCM10010200_007030 [Actinomadura rugatobispora]
MEINAAEVAAFVARLLGEGHALETRVEGAVVHLPESGLRVAVDAPDPESHGKVIRIPIGVNHPAWGEAFAWDQAVGVASGERHPVADAVDGWVHNVFPVFAAMAMPGSELAGRAHPFVIASGDRTADVYCGPLAIRDFGGLAERLWQAAAERPPAMALVQELFTGYAIPERPLWAYVYAARMPDGPRTEVTLLNGDSSEAFAHIADYLPWEGHGSVKSWVLAVPHA